MAGKVTISLHRTNHSGVFTKPAYSRPMKGRWAPCLYSIRSVALQLQKVGVCIAWCVPLVTAEVSASLFDDYLSPTDFSGVTLLRRTVCPCGPCSRFAGSSVCDELSCLDSFVTFCRVSCHRLHSIAGDNVDIRCRSSVVDTVELCECESWRILWSCDRQPHCDIVCVLHVGGKWF